MAQLCAVCGKKPALGNTVTHRGKAKYLGGVGTKVTGISRRTFVPIAAGPRHHAQRHEDDARLHAVPPQRRRGQAGRANCFKLPKTAEAK